MNGHKLLWALALPLCAQLLPGLPVAHAADGRMSLTLASLPPLREEAPVAAAASAAPAGPVARPTELRAEGRFDFAVNNAPASQVFLQLGTGTAYNMLVPPDVTGTITLSLKQTTVVEALEALRELYGYDFRVTGNRVFVYPNTVQTRMFKINYLPGRRVGTSDLRVSSSAIAQAGSTTGGAAATGVMGSTSGTTTTTTGGTTRGVDTAAVRTTSDTDFWREVKESLGSLIGQDKGRSVTLNPGAGVIVVRATPAELRQVADYLRAVQLTIERQVMLEAKIVEIKLSQSSQMGVNWSLFRGLKTGNKAGIVNSAPGVTLSNSGSLINADAAINPGSSVITESLGKGFYGLAFQSANFAALLSFLETQGDVQVLSSPRIATLNNQKAVLKVGSDELFVTNVTTTQTSSGSSTTSSPSLTLQPFFSGIALDVTPQIDDAGTVMLHVHPTVSSVAEKEKAIDLGTLGSYKLPLATSSINETDSIVRVRDGQIVAIGGLMQQDSITDRNGVPGLADVPGIGGLFRYKSSSSNKHELVILIKPTVISEDGQNWPEVEIATPKLSQAKPGAQAQ
ncbi:pilus (MSHA type) biogenesis protein MshL [Aquabacterium sp.]|uniref:pilus (MSHA type) biogenesis protein MshL n=1 Tax=Aquabacterium sp. TaxID=1872578 RepID=UPI0035C66FDA